MKQPGLPAVPISIPELSPMLRAVKERLEILDGSRGGKIASLDPAATLPQAVAKINEILTKIHGG